MGARILFRDSQGRDGSCPLSTGEPCVVGRSLDCAIRTDDALVSRQHSVIRMEGGRFYVEDLGSSNGTHVNDSRVTKHVLSHNDVVRCGSLWLRYVEEDGLGPPALTEPHGASEGVTRRVEDPDLDRLVRELRNNRPNLRAQATGSDAPTIPPGPPGGPSQQETADEDLAAMRLALSRAEMERRQLIDEIERLRAARREVDEVGQATAETMATGVASVTAASAATAPAAAAPEKSETTARVDSSHNPAVLKDRALVVHEQLMPGLMKARDQVSELKKRLAKTSGAGEMCEAIGRGLDEAMKVAARLRQLGE